MKKILIIFAALIFAVISCGDKQESKTTEKGGEGMDAVKKSVEPEKKEEHYTFELAEGVIRTKVRFKNQFGRIGSELDRGRFLVFTPAGRCQEDKECRDGELTGFHIFFCG